MFKVKSYSKLSDLGFMDLHRPLCRVGKIILSQMNKRRNDGGFYHSYDPNNVKDGRTFISKDDIELKMSQGKTAEVDSKGHMRNNNH